MKQTAEIRRRLLNGTVICGRALYLTDSIPNGRTRAGEVARKEGRRLISEPCRHRRHGDSLYHDYWLDPEQLRPMRTA